MEAKLRDCKMQNVFAEKSREVMVVRCVSGNKPTVISEDRRTADQVLLALITRLSF